MNGGNEVGGADLAEDFAPDGEDDIRRSLNLLELLIEKRGKCPGRRGEATIERVNVQRETLSAIGLAIDEWPGRGEGERFLSRPRAETPATIEGELAVPHTFQRQPAIFPRDVNALGASIPVGNPRPIDDEHGVQKEFPAPMRPEENKRTRGKVTHRTVPSLLAAAILERFPENTRIRVLLAIRPAQGGLDLMNPTGEQSCVFGSGRSRHRSGKGAGLPFRPETELGGLLLAFGIYVFAFMGNETPCVVGAVSIATATHPWNRNGRSVFLFTDFILASRMDELDDDWLV